MTNLWLGLPKLSESQIYGSEFQNIGMTNLSLGLPSLLGMPNLQGPRRSS